MKTYVIIGGDGVFGVHNAIHLLERANPRKVICVGRNPRKHPAYNLDVGKGDSRFAYHQIHLVFEQDRLLELFDREKPEIIINYAALAHSSSWSKSWRYYDTNVTALARLAEELSNRDYLERFIQIGTSELYGSCDFPAKEDTPLRPSSPYAVSKMAGDLHLLSMANVMQFPMNIIRPSNCYGPGQQLHRILPRSVVCGLTGKKMPLHGGGVARKSFLHARDLAQAVHLVSEKAPLGRVYNVGPENSISMRDLVERAAEVMGVPFVQLAEMAPGRPGEDSNYWLDSTAIREDLDWRPCIPLDEGLEELVEWAGKYLDFLKTDSSEFVLHA